MLLQLSENNLVRLPVGPRHGSRRARKRPDGCRWLMSPRIAPTLDPNKTRANRQVRAQIIDVTHDKDHLLSHLLLIKTIICVSERRAHLEVMMGDNWARERTCTWYRWLPGQVPMMTAMILISISRKGSFRPPQTVGLRRGQNFRNFLDSHFTFCVLCALQFSGELLKGLTPDLKSPRFGANCTYVCSLLLTLNRIISPAGLSVNSRLQTKFRAKKCCAE